VPDDRGHDRGAGKRRRAARRAEGAQIRSNTNPTPSEPGIQLDPEVLLDPSKENRGGSVRPGSPRRVKASRRLELALALRSRFLGWAVIARRLGYKDESGARRAVRQALEQRRAIGTDQMRTEVNVRLDWLTRHLARDLLVGVEERRARMNGLDVARGAAVEVGLTLQETASADEMINKAIEAAKAEVADWQRDQAARLDPAARRAAIAVGLLPAELEDGGGPGEAPARER
jgi:hypothetical protein